MVFKKIMILALGAMLIACKVTDISYCGNPRQATIEEIATLNVYKETAVIKLASFKYNFETGGHLPTKGGRVDMSGFYEVTTLRDEAAKNVMDVLVNYDLSANPDKDRVQDVYFCYNPRNAILFVDDKEQVIGYVEICFECIGIEQHPASLRVGGFCSGKFDMIKAIFLRNSIRYGIALEEDRSSGESDKESTRLDYEASKMVLMARAHVEYEEFEKASQESASAVQLDSTNRYAYFLLGHSLLKMCEYEKAGLAFNTVIKLDPGFRQAYYERALTTMEIAGDSQDEKLLTAICWDLEMAQKLGDDSVSGLKARYCK